jgi:hypothetical protein
MIEIRALWENKKGKLFDRIIEYQLSIVEVGTVRSYYFVPTGKIINLSQ